MADPVQTNFAPLAATAIAGSAAGSFSAQPIGKAIGDLVIWGLSLHCSCAPPPNVSEAISLLSVTSVAVGISGAALFLRYFFLKMKG
jgi:hypothetical protein